MHRLAIRKTTDHGRQTTKTDHRTLSGEARSASVTKDDRQRRQTTDEKQQTTKIHPWWYNFKYMPVGILFGIVFIKAEIISWYRIQEMFRLQNFHMYGVIGTAVVVGITSGWLIKKFNIKTIHGEKPKSSILSQSFFS